MYRSKSGSQLDVGPTNWRTPMTNYMVRGNIPEIACRELSERLTARWNVWGGGSVFHASHPLSQRLPVTTSNIFLAA